MMRQRQAGDILRYHTRPTLQKQSVAAHTWNILRIWVCVFPDVPVPLIAVLQHDCGEIRTGDLLFEVKTIYPEVGEKIRELEEMELEDQSWPRPGELSADQILVLKLCDLLEMLEFALVEIRLGNLEGREIHSNVTTAMRNRRAAAERTGFGDLWQRAWKAREVMNVEHNEYLNWYRDRSVG